MKKFLILFLAFGFACNSDDPGLENIDFRQEMRTFVGEISAYAKTTNPDFIIIPQNGVELVTLDGNENGPVATEYIAAIDAVGQEDLFYGYDADNVKTPATETAYLSAFIDIAMNNGKAALVTDYCFDQAKMDDANNLCNAKGYLSFAAPDRELSVIPTYPAAPVNENNRDILKITDAANFLYLINPGQFTGKQDFIAAVAATNYDVILMDAFFNDEIWLASEIAQLKTKANGGQRLVISYMSIGEAEDYRYYWLPEYATSPPEWYSAPNPDWPGNYKVKYWLSSWKAIIYGSDTAYLDKLLQAGFDGAYLDIIDGYEYFEGLL